MGISAGSGSRLCAYETAWNEQQHVFFVGGDKRVHELVYVDHWYHNDVTGLATKPVAAPIALPASALAGYVTAWNKQQHVIYLSAGDRINELVYADHWYHHDLVANATVPTQAPVAATGSALAGYVTNRNQQQHVIYLGTECHVHELCYAGRWYHHDLTAESGAPLAKAGSALCGTEITYSSALDWQQSVYFVGADDHVYELLYAKAGWSFLDLCDSAVNGTPPDAAAGTALAGFETPDNEQRHVIYVGTDGHVHELVHNNYDWYTDDLTETAYLQDPTGGKAYHGNARVGGLVGFPWHDSCQLLLYIGVDSHIHELDYVSQYNQWATWDKTNECHAPAVISGSPLAVYVTTYEGKEYVYVVFLGAGNHVCQLAPRGPDWHDLTQDYYS